MRHFEAGAAGALGGDAPYIDGPTYTLEFVRAEVFKVEHFAQLGTGARRDDQAILGRRGLHAAGEIDDFAGKDRFAGAGTLHNLTKIGTVACHRGSCRQWPSVRDGDFTDRLDNGQARADRPFSGIFVGAGVAEEGEDRVAHETIDEAFEARDHACGRVLELADDPAHHLGILLLGHFGVADQVADQDGHRPQFLFRWMCGVSRGLLRQWRPQAAGLDGRHQFTALPERQAEFDEVGFSEQGKHVQVDVSRAKRVCMLAEPECGERRMQAVHVPDLYTIILLLSFSVTANANQGNDGGVAQGG